MGIFTRVTDIISSNLNAMLDKAEDPEKMVKMMIREMEDTLVEIKASCAGAMANKKKVQRAIEESDSKSKLWNDKAKLAVDKGREDLAREALMEKRRYTERSESLENELTQSDVLVEQYQSDILQLEEKLASAREKQRLLVARHTRAQTRIRAERNVRRYDTTNAMHRFENLEQRIDRMEAEGDLVNFGRKPTLEDEFDKLDTDDEIEAELEKLKAGAKKEN